MNIRHCFLSAPVYGLILFSLLYVPKLESATDPGRSRVTLYKEYCLVCHGDKGDGNGFAAKFLDPKPRDFTSGKYKIRSTTSLPTNDDINRVITKGIPGTLMPAFKQDLDEQEISSLVAHIKDFTDAFDGETPEPITIPNPPPKTEELLAMGEKLYVDAGCGACHGSSGKGDGPSAKTLQDTWGYSISPYDFTIPGRMKGGSTVGDIYRALYVGIGGTPMPAYGETYTEEQNWGLAYYALSLSDSDEDSDDWGDDDDDWGDESSETVEGDSNIGKDLVMGVKPFENGGPPCIGCHSVMGIGASGGGPWGPDLTIAHQKFKEYGLETILETIPFPTMGPLFHPRRITDEERGHIVAFLKSTESAEVQIASVKASSFYTQTIIAGILGVILLTFIGLIAGKKNMELK